MSDREIIGWLTVRQAGNLPDTMLLKLMQEFDSAESFFSAPNLELQRRFGLSAQTTVAVKSPPARKKSEEEFKTLQRAGIRTLWLKDPAYPHALANIHQPPAILYVRGELRPEDDQALAIVGSRRASPYGLLNAERMARELADLGLTIVSGLARGVDAAAHKGALAAGGRTLAVLGCGLDICYPPEHSSLLAKIESRGAVISEYPVGTRPYPGHFPHRNRIISGLSLGTLVVEAAEHSGSLITAQLALDQGREVFAIPGNLGSDNSRGTNRLIKAGAKLVEQVEDILEELEPHLRIGRQTRRRAAGPALDPVESNLYDLLSQEPRHIDELISKTAFSTAQVSGALLQLELKGTVRQLSGQLYVRN